MPLRRRADTALNPWPGYVDALSTLLMVIIFVLLVFVLAQAFLSVALSGRDQTLERLNQQVSELADMLSLEKGRTAELRGSLAEVTGELRAANSARDALGEEVAGLRETTGQAKAERDAASQARGALTAQVSDLQLQLDSARLRVKLLQGRLVEEAGRADQASGALSQIALLTRQVEALKTQLQEVAAALDTAKSQAHEKDQKIADLGSKLNLALASKVAELQRYRSEFFGRLRQVLANRPGITVVGDRFVFQSEVLFPVGSAELSAAGAEQMRKLATTLKSIEADIPKDVGWVLRVDGHADRQKLHGRFASNWELSAARAISVVKLLVAEGIPPNRLAATGFGEFQPLDGADTAAAYAKNRRIELRLTDR